jgi:outer membrane protein assembly factor BamD (BamD/ComL family)
MKKPITIIFICSVPFFFSCKNGQNQSSAGGPAKDSLRAKDIRDVRAIETKLKDVTTLDNYNANMAIAAYTRFATQFPDDSVTPKFLFKAASLAMSSRQYQRALSFYDNIYTKYPNFNQAPDCIFVEGFIYDSFLKDTAKAHAKYQEVITKFPNNNLAQQAKAAIAALGKSDEELIKEFEEKNKKQGDKKAI